MQIRLRRNFILLLTALFALVWVFHRAHVQALSLDEATTYVEWVEPAGPAHWSPHSNNHVLNSILMRVAVRLFGISELSLRLPALFGAVAYIASAFGICCLLARDTPRRLALFACFVFNPFVMDYLVAARGYALALGFFTAALYLLARSLLAPDDDTVRRMAWISALAGLTVCSNFSFGFASVALLVVSLGVIVASRKDAFIRVAIASAVPAGAIVLVLAGSALSALPRDQLFWGANSFSEMWEEIRRGSFLELNPYLVNPLLASFFHAGRRLLLPAIALFVVALAFGDIEKPKLRFGACCAGIGALALFAHALQFWLLKIPLPYERTSIFFVPLMTGLIGAAVSAVETGWLRIYGLAIVSFLGIHFAGELRDSYFREWREAAEIKEALPVLLDVCRRNGIHEVMSDLNLTRSFNFYRKLYGIHDVDEFPMYEKMPGGKPVYVLLESRSEEFIRSEGLHVVWRGTVSDVVVLVRQPADTHSL